MGHQKNRLACGGPPAVPGHQGVNTRCKFEHLHIVGRQPCGHQPPGHCLGGLASVPGRVAGIDFHQFLENGPLPRTGVAGLRHRNARCQQQTAQHQQGPGHGMKVFG